MSQSSSPTGRGASGQPVRHGATVAVIGAGPVGLTLALELSRLGVRPLLLEADEELGWSSRAICISRRSQEIFDRIGVGAAVNGKGLGWNSGRTFYRDQLIFELEMADGPGEKHRPFINLQQFYTEQFLLDALLSEPTGADIWWGARVRAVEQDEAGVSMTIARGSEEVVVHALWAVAADGARSTVRDQLGLSLVGTSYEGRYLIADIVIDRPAAAHIERRVWFDPPSNPGSTVILHVQPDNVWRVDYQLRDDEDPDEALKPENIIPRIQSHLDYIGEDAPWRLHWKSLYKAHSLTLPDYRCGRVLFAGDAAHLVPIFGVRGLNSGIEDAHNLGWKLAMVVRDEAGDALLDTYGEERLQATRENIRQATKSTWFMSPPSRGFGLMRDAVLSLAGTHELMRPLINPRQASAQRYAGASLSLDPIDATGIAVGAPLPNVPVNIDVGGCAGRLHLHDVLNTKGRFELLLFAEQPAPFEIETLRHYLCSRGLPVDIVELRSRRSAASDIVIAAATAAAFDPAAHSAYLVRPDEHVAARFERLEPERIEAALKRALGEGLDRRVCGPATVAAADLSPAQSFTPLERVFASLSGGIDRAGGDPGRFLDRLSSLLAAALAEPVSLDALKAAADPARSGRDLYLARLCLLLAEAIGDASTVAATVEQALSSASLARV